LYRTASADDTCNTYTPNKNIVFAGGKEKIINLSLKILARKSNYKESFLNPGKYIPHHHPQH
jgi:hypothetical protein